MAETTGKLGTTRSSRLWRSSGQCLPTRHQRVSPETRTQSPPPPTCLPKDSHLYRESRCPHESWPNTRSRTRCTYPRRKQHPRRRVLPASYLDSSRVTPTLAAFSHTIFSRSNEFG